MKNEKLIDNFDVREWASSKIYRRGAEYFRDDRVTSFELDDDDTIRAEVEGTEIYNVKISWSDDGEPVADCTCPYDWEPLCKHAVAAILYWQESDDDLSKDALPENEGLPGTEGKDVQPQAFHFNREEYIAELAELERKKRASKKLLEALRILKKPKGELCGEYLITSGTANLRYTVTVRDGMDIDHTTCNCQDFLVNELGTCKHIELVKTYIGRQKKGGARPQRKNKNVWISLVPKDSYKGLGDPYEDIHIHANDPAIRERLFGAGPNRHWLADGYLRNESPHKGAARRFASALKVIEQRSNGNGSSKIIVSPEVHNLTTRMDADRSWGARVDEIIREPSASPEWREIKSEININLYEYQEKGILFAARNKRSFLGDDMGLGKTVQAIAAALLIKKLAGKNRVIIFCPASLKYQWKKEIEKRSKEKADIIQGARTTRRELYKKSEAMFLIVNYELIFRDEEFFHGLGADMIILDEAQRIKNWETKTAKGIKRLRSEFALALTGTPFENRLVELQSLCEFLHPRALGPMWRLLPTYGELDAGDKLVGFSNLSQLRQKIAPFFLRRQRDEVLSQLPERIVNEYSMEIGREQKKYHDDYEEALARILSNAKKRPLTPEELKRAFMCLTGMRIISNALAQHDWKKYRHLVDGSKPLTEAQIRSFHSPKLMEFRSVMEELLDKPNAKFVIFSQWERMLFLAEAAIRDLLLNKDAESVIFSGSLPTAARPKVIERFINDPKLRIFFSTDAGGVGLNLQESASYVINLEMPWNPAVLEQRISRVHRLGQKNTVNAINFISTNCVEERVYAAVQNKKALFDGVFDGQTDGVTFEKSSSFIERLRDMIGDPDEACKDEEGGEHVIASVSEAIPRTQLSAGDCHAPSELPPNNRRTGAMTRDLSPKTEALRANDVETAAVEGRDSVEPGRKEFDVTNILKGLGAWIGNTQIANCPDGALKVGIKNVDGEIQLSLKRPPVELISGLKDAIRGFAAMLGG